jgi:serine protease
MSRNSLKTNLTVGAAALALGASSISQANTYAGNPYSPTASHEYRHGVVPTVETWQKMHDWAAFNPDFAATGPNTLSFGGGIDGIGVTSAHPKVYLVVYGTQWGTAGTGSNGNMTLSNDAKGELPRLQQLFKGLGTGSESWSGTMTQYCDGSLVATGATSCPSGAPHVGYPTGGALAGVWYDNSVASPSAASGNQLAREAIKAASHFGNTTAASNRYAQYVILSPPKANPDHYKTGGFCAWHDYNGDTSLSGGAAASNVGDIAFTNLPYITDAGASCGANFVNSGSAGALDGVSIVEGHEYAETISDQNPGGGWVNFSSGAENGDECAWISSGQGASANVTMGNGAYAMQSTWSNDTNRCDIAHTVL